jgi:hypothetical protein
VDTVVAPIDDIAPFGPSLCRMAYVEPLRVVEWSLSANLTALRLL